MFRTRLLTVAFLLPLALAAIGLGGVWLLGFVVVILTLAVVEFCRLVERGGFQPATGFAVLLLWFLLLDAQWPAFKLLGPGLSLVLMASLAWQLAHRDGSPVADWALTIAGGLYVGWCGAHLIRLRALPDGLWWMMTALPAIWLADSGAYSIGRAWGRHKLAPTLSPGKTWEGYLGGIVTGTLGSGGLMTLWGLRGWPSRPDLVEGLWLGLLVATLAPLGDLVVSMIKRQAGAKDSGKLFPGHGGALDRVDSVLWACVIGYYFALWLHGS